MIELIGLAAGMLTTGSQFPQAWKIHKTKSTGDLSCLWVSILFAGTCVWLCYGLAIKDIPLILWNGISIITLGYIVFHKYRDIGPYYMPLLRGPFAIIKTKTDRIDTQSPKENL